MDDEAQGRGWRRTLLASCVVLAVVSMLFTSLAVRAQQQSPQASLASLLEQLQELQEEGALPDIGGSANALDRSREGAANRFSESTFVLGQREQERFQVRGLSLFERLLIQKFCTGEINEVEDRVLRLITAFSHLERDYCTRAGEVLLQFGYELFEGFRGPEFLVNGAIQDDYVLGIGDELVIIFHGREAQTVTVRIDREGRLMVPNMAPLPAAGRSFGDVRRDLESRTAAALLGTEVYVSLGAVRQLSIVVTGEVARPGVHQLTGLSTVFDAIGLAGGIKKTGSLRRIQVRRGDRISWIDAYDLLLAGGIGLDLALFDGDQIIVPSIGPTVAIGGQVKKPGIYEMPEGSKQVSLAGLLEHAGGPLRPKGNRFSLISFDDDGRERISDRQDTATAVMDGEIIIVNQGHDIQLGGVELVGHVRAPGRRPLSAAPTMRALLGDANSLSENPYLLFAGLETTDPVTQARRLFPIGLQRILSGEQDFRLRDRDRLIVLGIPDIRFLSSASVQNAIRLGELVRAGRPASVEPGTDKEARRALVEGKRGEISAADLLARLSADSSAAVTSIAEPKTADGAVPEEAVVCSGLLVLAALVAESRPGRFTRAVRTLGGVSGEVVALDAPCPRAFEEFPDLLPFVLEHVAAINGEVRIPGAYPIVPDTPLSHLVAVAGGITLDADLTALEVSRYSPDPSKGKAVTSRDLVDLGTQAMAAIRLGPGDVIRFNQVFSDRDTGPVFISGEVARPGFYQIRRGERLSEVVARAGGLTPQAYPFGAVFTRERVREAQQVGFRRAARELNSALALAAANRDVDPTGLLALFELTSELSDVDAVGRVVIEADPTVLQVRPELDTLLEPDDRLFVPKRPNSVLVIGDVLSPGALQFVAGTKIDDYIRQAGGFQRSADEDRIFVVFPNGSAQPVSVSVWNYSPIQVPPGSTVVVPKDPAPLDLFQLTREFAQIVSQLAITAASLAVIGDN